MILVDYNGKPNHINNNNYDGRSSSSSNNNNNIVQQQQQQQQPNEKYNSTVNEDGKFRIISYLDQEMQTILNRCDIDDVEKWKLYSQALERYLYYIKSKTT